MGLTVADVVKFEYPCTCMPSTKCDFCKILSSPISPEKVVGMVSISEDKLKEILNYAIKPIFDRGIAVGMRKDEGHIEGDLTEERDELVREIISNKSKILSVKGER